MPDTVETPTPTELAPWIGWLRRPKGRWWIASDGQTESGAFTRLLDASRRDGLGHHDLLVLPRDEEP